MTEITESVTQTLKCDSSALNPSARVLYWSKAHLKTNKKVVLYPEGRRCVEILVKGSVASIAYAAVENVWTSLWRRNSMKVPK